MKTVKIISKQPDIVLARSKNPKFAFHMGSEPISVPEDIAYFLVDTMPQMIVLYNDKRTQVKDIKTKRGDKFDLSKYSKVRPDKQRSNMGRKDSNNI